MAKSEQENDEPIWPKKDKVQRDLNPEIEAALPPGPIPLLQKFEQVIGSPLRKLNKNEVYTIKETGTPWVWSWSPEQVAMFLQSWDSQVYMASPLLSDVARTPDPAGGGFLYERFCPPTIIDAIRKIQIMYDKPLGKLRPVPKGTFQIDLRIHPPQRRPTVFRINDWAFAGLVKDIPEDLRNELAYRHSRWMQREMRVMQSYDHEDEDLGALNAPTGRGAR